MLGFPVVSTDGALRVSFDGAAAGAVLELHDDLLLVRFEQDPGAAIGSLHTLRFSGDRVPPVTVAAVVSGRLPAGRYWLRLANPQRAQAQLRSALFRIFDRRRSVRVQKPLRAMIGLSGQARPRLFKAAVDDLSGGGVGVMVLPRVERHLCSADKLVIQRALPELRPFEVAGEIRVRALAGERVRYGVAFLEEGTADFSKKSIAILDFVMRQHRGRLNQSRSRRPS